jgi:hypothetical protein
MAHGGRQPLESERLALAQVAREAALDAHGVASLDPRPPMAGTAAGGGRVDGVTCVAVPGGRYEVTLYVVARPVSLERLGEDLRNRIRRSAEAHGLGDELGPVNVIVTDVATEEAVG